MINEDNLSTLDMLEAVGDTENFLNSENINTEISDCLGTNLQNSAEVNSEDLPIPDKKTPNTITETQQTKLPKNRIKNIIKMDPDVNIVSAEAVFLVTRATELFLETIAKETFSHITANKRKTITKKDLDIIIDKVDCLCFLEGAMDF